ncbi:MAG TPA: efflux RND transporter periplasmic adaptor subunit [Candidatus Didemnitutus sp.]|nr:efflux RND transporter periplasmic adaptor subunit [Candidatus Didemnitutus sp.]
MKTLLIVVLVAALGGGAWYAYHVKEARAEATPEYTTAIVGRGDVLQLVTATGQIDAVLSVDVGSQISGLITKLYVDYNSPVKENQKLAELDPSSYQQSLLQAEANLASAEASEQLAELNERRSKELLEKALITQQDYDSASAQLKQAKAQQQINAASVENAKVNLSRCTIYSPIDGIVIAKLTEVGKTVAAGLNVPTLFTVDNDLTNMQITAAVAEADVGQVTEGQKATFTVDAFPNRSFSGTITQVRNAPQNTNNVITYNTIITVENKDLKLRPGMTANVSIIVARRDKTLKVPNAALRVRMPEGILVTQTTDAKGDGKEAKPVAAADSGSGRGRGGMFGANASPEQREKMRAIMAEIGFAPGSGPPSTEQREQMRKLMVERGLITQEQADAMASRPRNSESTYVNRTVYRLPAGNKLATPEAITVRVGITDGLVSEIANGLNEGDTVITSAFLPNARPAAPAANPFAGGRRF